MPDRLEVIELRGYTEQEKLAIAERHLLQRPFGADVPGPAACLAPEPAAASPATGTDAVPDVPITLQVQSADSQQVIPLEPLLVGGEQRLRSQTGAIDDGTRFGSRTFIQRVWREADLRPHRLARCMASNDPDFETKAADIIGLYLDPPRHAAVFCIDEKTAIQALDRRDRVLPLSPGRVERHGFEYERHGTLSLYAALNVRTGEVRGKTTARHTSLGFVGFLGEVVATRAPDEEIHVILDHLSAHKTKLVEGFLDEHPNVTLHFTPTYSSWLKSVTPRRPCSSCCDS